MGNIRPSFIKIRAIMLCEQYGDRFTDDFDHNKVMVEQLTDVPLNAFATALQAMSQDIANAVWTEVSLRIAWDRTPISVHGPKAQLQNY